MSLGVCLDFEFFICWFGLWVFEVLKKEEEEEEEDVLFFCFFRGLLEIVLVLFLLLLYILGNMFFYDLWVFYIKIKILIKKFEKNCYKFLVICDIDLYLYSFVISFGFMYVNDFFKVLYCFDFNVLFNNY